MGMLLGLSRPTADSFGLLGSSGRHEESLRRVGAVVESPAMYPSLTGRENLAYVRLISGHGSPGELDQLIDRVGLTGRADGKFRTSSLGMKQRLGIAFALLGDPDLVFSDEPTNGLDAEGMIEVRELIPCLGDGSSTMLQ